MDSILKNYINNNELLRSIQTLKKIWDHPGLDRKTIVAYQNEKLRSLVTYAYKNVKYYKTLFDMAGIKPADIKHVKDLRLIPLTSSKTYRVQAIENTLSRKVKLYNMVQRPTNGSTGRPFIIRRTRIEEHLLNFFRVRALRSMGKKVSDKTAAVGFVSISSRKNKFPGKLRQALGINRVYHIDYLNSAHKIIDDLRRIAPDIISGHPGVLSHTAHHLKKNNFEIIPKLIFTGGESLTSFRRKSIEQGFRQNVYDTYGSNEFNLLAWECNKTGGYHVCDDNIILEILKDKKPVKPGESGEVVVTGLHSYGMPFIRYQLGDIATYGAESCPCGQPFSTISSIEGRIHDLFEMPDGELIHPVRITVPILEKESSWIDQFQVLQIRKDKIILKIQPFITPNTEQVNHVKKLARNILPPEVTFDIELVDRICFEATGKFQFCQSLIPHQIDVNEY